MTAAGKKPIRRRNYFIKKPFQAKFIVGFVVLLALQTLLIGALFMYVSSQTLTTGYTGSRFIIDKTSSFFFVSFVVLSITVGATIALAGMLVFVLLSHSIAGPLYRFERTLLDIADGNLASRTSLRKTDQLKDLQGALNNALGRMDNQLKEIKSDLDEAEGLLGDKDRAKSLGQIEKVLARIKAKLAFFKTS